MKRSDEAESERSTRLRAPLLIGVILIGMMMAIPGHSLAQTAQPEDLSPSFSDGKWAGAFAAAGPYSVGETTGQGAYYGNFLLTSMTGQLDGTYSLSGNSSAASAQSEATGDVTIDGLILGSSDLPVMQGQSGSAHVVGSAAGFPIDENITLGPGDFTEMRINLISATCTEVIGDYTTAANGIIQQGGGTGYLEGSFMAVLVDYIAVDNPDVYLLQIFDVIQSVEDFKSAVMNGQPFDTDDLQLIVDQANDLARGIQRNDACGLTIHGSYIMAIQQAIGDLLQFALDHPDQFDGYDLYYLTSAAVGTGLIGAGSPNPGVSAALKQSLVGEMNSRLDDPNTPCIDVNNIAAAAWLLNDLALMSKADQVSSACGGN